MAKALRPVLRFAPSPNGELHLGHAYSALFAYDMAQRLGGRFLLRIEDIDQGRARAHFETQIRDDLNWLGLQWEEPVRRQSEHYDTYRTAAGQLDDLGLLYPCFASRKDIMADNERRGDTRQDPDGAPFYGGLHRSLTADEVSGRKAKGEPFALRLDMNKAIKVARARMPWPLTFDDQTADPQQRCHVTNPADWGDVVIVRKDTPTSYHLSVVVDDALQGITHVTRGMDLFRATDIHRLLQVLLALPEPFYGHHQLITGDHGRKLAKSAQDMSLASMRNDRLTPKDIRALIGMEIGG